MSDDDSVGYGRPPKHTRFQKGQSGNPEGARKHRRRTIADEVHDELRKTVHITEEGVRKRVTKRRVIAKQIVNKGAAADLRAAKMVDELDRAASERTPAKAPTAQMTESDQQIAARMMERIVQIRGLKDE